MSLPNDIFWLYNIWLNGIFDFLVLAVLGFNLSTIIFVIPGTCGKLFLLSYWKVLSQNERNLSLSYLLILNISVPPRRLATVPAYLCINFSKTLEF